MEMNILHAIQNLHNSGLDSFMVAVFNNFVGSKGQLWVYIGIILFLIPNTRKCGIGVLLTYLLCYFISDGILKELISRPRPCAVDKSIVLLIKRPSSFSCPSVHACLAFGSAFAIFLHYKKIGIICLIFAALVGFSRMYFFVHYPTDILFGALSGVIIAYFIYLMTKKSSRSL